MSLKANVESGFVAATAIDSGSLALDGGEPFAVLLPEGISHQSETGPGVHRGSTYATVTALKSAVGSRPKPGTRAVLGYAGEDYNLSVTDDDIAETGGALYTFTLSS